MMQLSITGLVPNPIGDKVRSRESGIWNSNLIFQQGELIFLQAPSGTGKTTLLQLLYGLRTDYEGQVSWGGQVLATQDAEAIAILRTRHLSIVFQDLRLFPALTASENIEIKRLQTDTVSSDTVIAWAERLGIASKMDTTANKLSYGEQQRVAIIRALAQPFAWLLMDEPFSHLDEVNRVTAAALIMEVVTQQGAGFFLADLDPNSYFPYTKTIVL